MPIFHGKGFTSVTAKITETTKTAIDQIDDDPYWARKNKILDIAHNEFLDDQVLHEMTFSDILKLRTSEWKKYDHARAGLFTSLAVLSQEIGQEGHNFFQAQLRKRLSDYKQKIGNFEAEREKLRFKVKCDVGLGFGAMGLAYGALSLTNSPLTIPGTLLASAMWVLNKTKEHGPEIKKLCRENDTLHGASEFGLYDFFRQVGK